MARLEVVAIPGYFATMGLEYAHHRARNTRGIEAAGDYERRDTLTSLTMGLASLAMPLITPKLLAPITPGKGRYAKHLVGGALGAVAITTAADVVVRRTAEEIDDTNRPESDGSGGSPGRAKRRRRNRIARRIAKIGGAVSIAAGTVAATTGWGHLIRSDNLWKCRVLPDLGTGVLAWSVAILGWDALYYLNHRAWHSTRFMWANHVMHHSSERYNLSTALRQAVTDPLLILIPYTGLCLVGVRPELVASSRSINLIYQYWVHTDAIRTMGPMEEFASTPSHHRVHHGSNLGYIDRNHGGILIVWDRLLGTFTREDPDEPVVYGLTRNIDTFNPIRVAWHEYADIIRDVANAENWRDRLSFAFRGPGWAYERHRAMAETPTAAEVSQPAPSEAVPQSPLPV